MNFVFLIQFDCLFLMMEICLFWARVILPNTGFPPYFRCGLYLNADYGTHFDFDTSSGKIDGELLTGMKNHFDTV